MPNNHTLSELSTLLKTKKVSSEELTKEYLTKIKNNNLNSFISITEQQAIEQAKMADTKLASGENHHPLLGVPFAHKDIFCTEGVKTSCGSKMLDNFIPPYNATVAEKFNLAGAVCLGKTNMDEYAMGSSNENSFYGPVKNPWNTDCVPGGSSGGSAAAVAARLIPGATGTDTGGSIRQPAALCGITGLKPTYGRVSRYGMIAFASSLDQGGPMTQTAEDAALMLQTMAGFDPKDSTSLDKPVPNYVDQISKPINKLKIGLPKEFFAETIDPEIAKATQNTIDELKKLGCEFIDISLPHSHLGIPAYYIIAPAECSANLSRYDGVRYGYRCDNPKDLEDMYKRSRGEAFGDEVKTRVLIGTYALSTGYYDAYYLKAQKIRRLIRDDFLAAFNQVDCILCPSTPEPAFKIGEKIADPISMYLSDIFTVTVNLAGLPGLSMPMGHTKNNLPMGVQLIGNYFDEGKILNIAHQYQLNTDFHKKQPEMGGAA